LHGVIDPLSNFSRQTEFNVPRLPLDGAIDVKPGRPITQNATTGASRRCRTPNLNSTSRSMFWRRDVSSSIEPPVTTVEDVHEGDRVFVQSAGLDS
jgi:hypothetical protein